MCSRGLASSSMLAHDFGGTSQISQPWHRNREYHELPLIYRTFHIFLLEKISYVWALAPRPSILPQQHWRRESIIGCSETDGILQKRTRTGRVKHMPSGMRSAPVEMT